MDKRLLALLVCPSCKATLTLIENRLLCKPCRLAYPIVDDIPVMLPEEAITLSIEEIEKLTATPSSAE